MNKLNNIFTEKQIQVLKSKARILVLHGAKRAGKTYALILKFALLVKKNRNKGFKYIIGGASLGAIKTNILDDLENMLGIEIKLSKFNTFNLFGNTILVREGSKVDSWKRVRGFTAYGCLLNEGTALHQSFIQECISRCSGEGAEIYIDTNPENPNHFIKKEYIDKAGQRLKDGTINVQEIHFKLEDNTFLDEIYKESIKLSTPNGMFYDRDILGVWVNARGIVYKDFDEKVHIIDKIPEDEVVFEYIACIDWGFEHYGALTIIAYTQNDNYFLVECIAEQHRYVEEFWLKKALELVDKYKINVFFGDYARPEYMNLFIDNNIIMYNPNKNVVPGIETVASLFKKNKLFVLKDASERFLHEINNYVWNDKIGKEDVVKKDDDVLDCIRYTIFTYEQKFK